MAEIKLNIHVITINVHGLNALLKAEFSIFCLEKLNYINHMRHTFKNRDRERFIRQIVTTAKQVWQGFNYQTKRKIRQVMNLYALNNVTLKNRK